MVSETNSPTCKHGIPIGSPCSECSKIAETIQAPEQIRESKIGLVQVFIAQAKEGRMGRDEVVERIDQLKGNNFITDEDVTTLTRKLDEALSEIT